MYRRTQAVSTRERSKTENSHDVEEPIREQNDNTNNKSIDRNTHLLLPE